MSVREESELIEPAKGRHTRTYSAQERAKALALYDSTGSLIKASQTLNIPMSTLATWARDPANYSQSRRENGLDLAQKFDNAANLFLDLAIKKSKRAAFNHLMTGAGIAVDKSQLLKGLPTAISASVDSDEDRQRKLAEIFGRIEARALEGEVVNGP
jgi:transposase-like protein